MSLRTNRFDLSGLRLSSGEARVLELHVAIDPFTLAGEAYAVSPREVPVRLDVNRTSGQGYALRLRFTASLTGPCQRCLEPAAPAYGVDAREIDQPGADAEDLQSPYVEEGVLELSGWARDALALTLPAAILCRPECAGLCPVCGADLNAAGPEHRHEAGPDPRWAKLSELNLPASAELSTSEDEGAC
jgi:uncharacterized protein